VNTAVVRPDPAAEFETPERCFILEAWNHETDGAVSIARARVEPGMTTQLHRLDVDERYVILKGHGVARTGDLKDEDVGPGDIVVIPAGMQQQITNVGEADLLFYCICSPRFDPAGYESLE
jgi:mannose-6-phosphate isomerase-like protein (cupin superfamily)